MKPIKKKRLSLAVLIILTATSIELPQELKPAALAQAGRRWKKFLEILSERVGGGQILFTDLPEKVFKPENFEEHKTEVKSNASSTQS
jgi:hypothetical protein